MCPSRHTLALTIHTSFSQFDKQILLRISHEIFILFWAYIETRWTATSNRYFSSLKPLIIVFSCTVYLYSLHKDCVCVLLTLSLCWRTKWTKFILQIKDHYCRRHEYCDLHFDDKKHSIFVLCEEVADSGSLLKRKPYLVRCAYEWRHYKRGEPKNMLGI